MSEYLSSRFFSLAPYVPGEQPQSGAFVKLNTNESPFPPAPGVVAALNRAEVERLNLYPDPTARGALSVLAQHYDLPPENILLGNGSDELLAFCFLAYCDAGTPACFPDISYGFYEVYARLFCLPTRVMPLSKELTVEKEYYYEAGSTIFIANPNAPTGHALPLEDIEYILQNNRKNVVVVDEAYVDFGAQSARMLLEHYDNLLVIQTMSKSRNLAGARLGFAMGSAELIADLNRMKFSFNPYNVNRLSLIAAEEAVRDDAYFRQCTDEIQRVRGISAAALTERGFLVLPSYANFLFAKPPALAGKEYYQRLREKGVLVRHFDHERIHEYVRITIGTEAQMQTLLDATDEILKER